MKKSTATTLLQKNISLKKELLKKTLALETKTPELQIGSALEKVRVLAFAETSAILFKQMILLGIEPNRLYMPIIKTAENEAEFWITDEAGSKISFAYTADLSGNQIFRVQGERTEFIFQLSCIKKEINLFGK